MECANGRNRGDARHGRGPTLGTLALLAGVATAAAVLGGCGRADRGDVSAVVARSHGVAGADPETGAAEAPIGPPVSDEECRAFARAVEGAVRSGDGGAAWGALIDWDAILRAATAGIPVPESDRNGFFQGVKTSMQQDQGLVPQVVATVQGGGSYTFLRPRARGPHKTALFRLVSPDSNGVNYHEFVLARREDGKVRAVDAYVFLSGELVSRTLRRMFLCLAARGAPDPGALGRLPGTEQAFLKDLPRFQRMTAEVRDGRPAEALATYRQLPPQLQKDKTILMLRLQAAQDAGDEPYARAIEDFRDAHPGDACIDMFSVDYYLLKRDYPRALACLDRLDRSVGGDPYVHVMRAGIHTDQGQYDLARHDARRAIAVDPDLQDAYWALLTVSLQDHHYADTVTLLDQLEGRFHIPFGDMTQLPVFSEFVRSPEYLAWKEQGKIRHKDTKDTKRDIKKK
jgi:hypothetical protein